MPKIDNDGEVAAVLDDVDAITVAPMSDAQANDILMRGDLHHSIMEGHMNDVFRRLAINETTQAFYFWRQVT